MMKRARVKPAYAKAKGWTVDPSYMLVDDNTSSAEWKPPPGFSALLAALGDDDPDDE